MEVARPTKLTPATVKKVMRALELGMTYRRACASAGISYDTFNDWRKTNPKFLEQCEEAEAAGVERCLVRIHQAAEEGTWQAGAWLLERRYPHEYGRTVQEQQGEHRIIIVRKNDWRKTQEGGDAE